MSYGIREARLGTFFYWLLKVQCESLNLRISHVKTKQLPSSLCLGDMLQNREPVHVGLLH